MKESLASFMHMHICRERFIRRSHVILQHSRSGCSFMNSRVGLVVSSDYLEDADIGASLNAVNTFHPCSDSSTQTCWRSEVSADFPNLDEMNYIGSAGQFSTLMAKFTSSHVFSIMSESEVPEHYENEDAERILDMVEDILISRYVRLNKLNK